MAEPKKQLTMKELSRARELPEQFLDDERRIQQMVGDPSSVFERWGAYQWCIGLGRAGRGEIYLAADELRVDNGHLLCVAHAREIDGKAKPESITFALAPGAWRYFHAASVLDGSAVSVLTWDVDDR
jgi:hypothetical protein